MLLFVKNSRRSKTPHNTRVTAPNGRGNRETEHLPPPLIRPLPFLWIGLLAPHSAHPAGARTVRLKFSRNKNVIGIPLHTPIKEDTWTYRRWGDSIRHKASPARIILRGRKKCACQTSPRDDPSAEVICRFSKVN